MQSVNAIEGLTLSKKADDRCTIANVQQDVSLDFYAPPESDGTPLTDPSFPTDKKTVAITEDFVFVATHISLEESIEMPLLVAHVDRATHWKTL